MYYVLSVVLYVYVRIYECMDVSLTDILDVWMRIMPLGSATASTTMPIRLFCAFLSPTTVHRH